MDPSQSTIIQVFTDRSRVLTYQDCHAKRYFNYHFDGIGIQSTRLNIPLATGTWVHHGLAILLSGGNIEQAVQESTAGYWDAVKGRGIEVEAGEDAAYMADEQVALVEGMLRAFNVVRLPILMSEYEVLEVERDECWPLTSFQLEDGRTVQINFMARLDALLLSKEGGDLYILSFKTAASWDNRRQREAEHDMQGLSELASVEYRLAKWWNLLHSNEDKSSEELWIPATEQRMIQFLAEASAPPKIAGVKMEYLLKGDRYADKNSNQRTQRSPLIRGYQRMNVIGAHTPDDLGWKYSWVDEWGKEKRLDYRTWKPFEVWKQPGGVAAWIDLLHAGQVQPDAGDPLAGQFASPLPYFRHEDDVRNWYEQVVFQESRIAMANLEMAGIISSAGWNSPESRTMMNREFPHYRQACDKWGAPCPFVDICYGANVSDDPVGSGMYMKRVPHHQDELIQIEGGK